MHFATQNSIDARSLCKKVSMILLHVQLMCGAVWKSFHLLFLKEVVHTGKTITEKLKNRVRLLLTSMRNCIQWPLAVEGVEQSRDKFVIKLHQAWISRNYNNDVLVKFSFR